MKLKGRVGRIFVDNGDGFKIFSLVVPDVSVLPQDKVNPKYPTSVSVLGRFTGIEEAYVLEVEGDWVYKDKGDYHPWSFSGKSFRIMEFETPDMIRRYLETLPCIGTVLAREIVAKFGTDTIRVLDEEYIRLGEIKGITAEKAEEIHNAHVQKQTYRKLQEYLTPYNVSETKLRAIQKKYAEKALENIQQNPYCLSNDGLLNFKTADAIANDLHFSATDDVRIEAAINTVLDVYAVGQGHSYLDMDVLVENAAKMFTGKRCVIAGKISDAFIRRKVIDFVDAKLLVNDDGKIYKTARYWSEVHAAQKIAHRASLHSLFYGVTDEQIDACIKKAEERFCITLAKKQREAVCTAVHSMTTIITGGPGTGKSTTLNTLLTVMDLLAEEMDMTERVKALAAPTGMAAKRMKEVTKLEAQTVHRLLEYVPYAQGEVRCKDESNPIEADVLVVDEASMLDIDLFSKLICAVKDTTMFILLGDVDQLPSVGAGNVLHDLIDSGAVPVVRLDQTYRQGSESSILVNANKINSGEKDLVFDKPDCRFFEIPDDRDSEAGDAVVRMIARVFFEEFERCGEDVEQVQVLCPMKKQSTAVKTKAVVNALNPILQDVVNPYVSKSEQMSYGSTHFRKGDKVMQFINNYDKNVFNGDVGIALEVSPSQNKMLVSYLGEVVEYQQDELDQVRHSFATTIHKSQGQEYMTVIIPVSMQYKTMLQRNLIYTGITRAKQRAYFIGDRKALEYAIDNTTNRQRNSFLKERIQNSEQR